MIKISATKFKKHEIWLKRKLCGTNISFPCHSAFSSQEGTVFAHLLTGYQIPKSLPGLRILVILLLPPKDTEFLPWFYIHSFIYFYFLLQWKCCSFSCSHSNKNFYITFIISKVVLIYMITITTILFSGKCGDEEGRRCYLRFGDFCFCCCCFLLLGLKILRQRQLGERNYLAPSFRLQSIVARRSQLQEPAGAGLLTSRVNNKAVKDACSASWLSPLIQPRCCLVMVSLEDSESSTSINIFKIMYHRHIQRPTESRQSIAEIPFQSWSYMCKTEN